MIEWLFSFKGFVILYIASAIVGLISFIYSFSDFKDVWKDDLSIKGKIQMIVVSLICVFGPVFNTCIAISFIRNFCLEFFSNNDCEDE